MVDFAKHYDIVVCSHKAAEKTLHMQAKLKTILKHLDPYNTKNESAYHIPADLNVSVKMAYDENQMTQAVQNPATAIMIFDESLSDDEAEKFSYQAKFMKVSMMQVADEKRTESSAIPSGIKPERLRPELIEDDKSDALAGILLARLMVKYNQGRFKEMHLLN